MKYKVGDFVRIVGGHATAIDNGLHSFSFGELVRIIQVNSYDCICESDSATIQYMGLSDIVPEHVWTAIKEHIEKTLGETMLNMLTNG